MDAKRYKTTETFHDNKYYLSKSMHANFRDPGVL